MDGSPGHHTETRALTTEAGLRDTSYFATEWYSYTTTQKAKLNTSIKGKGKCPQNTRSNLVYTHVTGLQSTSPLVGVKQIDAFTGIRLSHHWTQEGIPQSPQRKEKPTKEGKAPENPQERSQTVKGTVGARS